MAMGTYDDTEVWGKNELLGLAQERGLSAAGTRDEVVARLERWDEDPLAFEDDDEPVAVPAASAAADQPAGEKPAHRGMPDPARLDAATAAGPQKSGQFGGLYRAEFPCPQAEVDDALHRRLIADTHGLAQAAGLRTRGGITVGRRVGFSTDADGRRTVIYEVSAR